MADSISDSWPSDLLNERQLQAIARDSVDLSREQRIWLIYTVRAWRAHTYVDCEAVPSGRHFRQWHQQVSRLSSESLRSRSASLACRLTEQEPETWQPEQDSQLMRDLAHIHHLMSGGCDDRYVGAKVALLALVVAALTAHTLCSKLRHPQAYRSIQARIWSWTPDQALHAA